MGFDRLAQLGLLPVVPEHAGRPRVRKDVGVALVQVVAGEGPVTQGGPRVVVLDERRRARRPEPHEARGAPLSVHEAPALPPHDCLLQYPLRGEVERRGGAPRFVTPVHDALAVAVLVVVQDAVSVVARIPELPKGQRRHAAVDVLARELPRVALHVVKAPAVVADALPEPLQPVDQVLADALLGVVDVRGGCVVLARAPRAVAPEFCVVSGDGPRVPGQAPTEDVPPSLVVLAVRATVIDHDVRDALHTTAMKALQESHEVLLGAISGFRVVQIPRQVALGAHRVRRGGQPYRGEPRLVDCLEVALEVLVPVAAAVALPIEALEEDLEALARRGALGPSVELPSGVRRADSSASIALMCRSRTAAASDRAVSSDMRFCASIFPSGESADPTHRCAAFRSRSRRTISAAARAISAAASSS